MQIEIKDKLYKDILGYCQANDLDIDVFINNLLKKGLMLEKYGERPAVFDKYEQNDKVNEPVTIIIDEPKPAVAEEVAEIIEEGPKEVKKTHRKLK